MAENSENKLSPAALKGSGRTEPGVDPEAYELAEGIIEILEEKSAGKILSMNLEQVNPYFCIFVIASANSMVQLKSLAREIQKRMGHKLVARGLKSDDIESGWVIQDFGDVILHLFMPEQRSFYNLERLWGDAPILYRSSDFKSESPT
ncbi:MAG: ribosome silencing factor [Spirochaetaceae bacterium]|nr:ribosome silencing factor [Spirochaetaceae bacterium]|tara:strand:+ start:35670 stop:36113 length:444 start_codon:yes stop_codon:yes gene_type:complete